MKYTVGVRFAGASARGGMVIASLIALPYPPLSRALFVEFGAWHRAWIGSIAQH